MCRLILFATLAILAQIPHHTYATGQGVSATDPMFETYLSLGCWKDGITANKTRALPTIEGQSNKLDKHYKRRTDAVMKCAKAALQKGFEVFAVQDGGQCFSSADARSKYKQFGRSEKCETMKGGPMANDVYQISPLKKCLCLMPRLHNSLPANNTMCFGSEQKKNKINNQTALHVAAKFGETDCAKILINSHARIEAVDKDQKTPLQIAAGSKQCGVMKALVVVNANQDKLSNVEKANLRACIPATPQTGAQKIELAYERLGCFKDNIPRALDSLEGNKNVSLILTDHYKRRTDVIKKCYNAANFLGYKIFAVQDGGQCFSSQKAEVAYNKYGTSSDCASDGEGGPMANSVYKIKTA